MKRLLKWLFSLLLILIVGIGLLFVHVWYFRPAKLDWLYTRVVARFAVANPEMLSSMRILPPWLDFYSDDLADASPAEEERQVNLLKDDYATLKTYDRGALDTDGKLSYDVLE
ncbi:MAG TPA: hypothetical protein VM847_17365, partial [Tahibacter sp.]|nr:hypothetical protein [Tahibacter sp.]